MRLLGVGPTRPVLMLGDRTPGFQDGVRNMVIFSGRGVEPPPPAFARKPPFPPPGSVPFNDNIADANPGTFYPAMGNIDIAIGAGNEGAAAIRFHAAQHAYLQHMDFDLGTAFAGVYMVGNYGADLHFRGGRYGIVTEKPSPAWSFTLVDSTFDGQRDAAIREHEAGLTLLNVTFRNTPVGIEIDRGYGDWLYGQRVRFENVSKAAVIVSNEDNAFTQVSFDDAVATGTPVFARFRDSGRTVGRAGAYRVKEFTYGLTLPAVGAFGRYETRFDAEPLASLPAAGPDVIRDLPPVDQWVNVRSLGVKGDAKSDDTAALKAAIAAHRVLYFPSGFYQVSDTLALRPDTVLIALHPSTTQIVLTDSSPGFQGVGAPKALIEAPKGGDNIVVGLGLFTGGINARATALLWKAGATSLVDDVKIQGGHGTFLPDGSRFDPYDPYHAGDKDPRKRWDAQYHSIWVTDGGGGTFTNVWSVNTYAQSGFYVSETTTPGRILQLSAEHHGRVEIGLNRVENWELHAPQTEQEVGESPDALSLDIRNSRNILVTNYHGYRVTRTFKPAPMAVRLEHASGIRFRNVHVNAESGLGHLRQHRVHDLPARQQVPVRERDRGRDARPAGTRARVRRARRARRSEAAAEGAARAGLQGLQARRRLLVDFRRRRRTGRHALVRRAQVPSHLRLERGARPHAGARRQPRSGQPRRRQGRQPDGALHRWPRGDGLQLQARLAGNRDDGDRADRRPPRSPASRSRSRRTTGTTASSRISTIRRPISSRRWPRCSPATSRRRTRASTSHPTAASRFLPTARSSRAQAGAGRPPCRPTDSSRPSPARACS